jgi:hypothetical protein
MSLLVASQLTGVLDNVFKENGLLRKGNNLVYHCPFCNHRKRKFEICLDLPRKWNCWVCHTKGRGIKTLFSRIKVDAKYYKALEGIGLKENTYTTTTPEPDQNFLLLPPSFESLLKQENTREYKIAVRYAKSRGITHEDIIKYNIGYCVDGRWKGRIIFNSYDENNRLNFFTGRSYENSPLKYDNCDHHRNIIGFENMLNFNYPITLVEGPLDAIAVKRNASPLFGTYMSVKLKQKIIEYKPPINILLDPDAITHSINIAEYLLSNQIKTKLILIEKKDIGEMGFEEATKIINNTNYLDFSQLMRLKLSL